MRVAREDVGVVEVGFCGGGAALVRAGSVAAGTGVLVRVAGDDGEERQDAEPASMHCETLTRSASSV